MYETIQEQQDRLGVRHRYMLIDHQLATDIVQMLGPSIQESATAWNVVQALMPLVDAEMLHGVASEEVSGTDMMHARAPRVDRNRCSEARYCR